MSISPNELIKRLDALFEHEGVPYGRAYLLFHREDEHTNAAIQYKGYSALSDAFKCVFLETVELLNTECRPKIKAPLSEFYARFLPRLTVSFQSLCGAERVAIRGYPYSGYTLLRNIFDSLVLISAALQKFVDFNSIDGIEPGKPFDPDAARKLRKSTEFTVRRKMTGDQSGLSQQTMKELALWDVLFDYETHGVRLSLTQSKGWRDGTKPLAVRGESVSEGMILEECSCGSKEEAGEWQHGHGNTKTTGTTGRILGGHCRSTALGGASFL